MKKLKFSLMILVLLFSLVLSGCGTLTTLSSQALESAHAPTATPVAAEAPAASGSHFTKSGTWDTLEQTLEHIYDTVSPSVVSIQVVKKQTVTLPEQLPLPFFNLPVPQEPKEQYQHGAGSGFVWDTDGHIVTNNHVIEDADKITVEFSDGTTVPAEVVGTDSDSDLAVVKVDLPAARLHPVTLADFTQVRVGQLAVAIGNPFALENSMTVGFVSALGRSLPVASGDANSPVYTIPDVIQTDAPINPGNSGGVLVDDNGQVIGVPSAIISPVRASAGIGFAIPSAIVQRVVPVLIAEGHYVYPWMGISGISLDPDLAQAMGLDSNQHGALVVDVLPDGPADKAGLRGSDRQITVDGLDRRVGGDVIVAMDDEPVQTFEDVVSYLVRATQVGQTVNLKILRDGHERQVKITLGERPDAEVTSSKNGGRATAQGGWLGITGMTLTSEVAQAMKLPTGQVGVLVGQVANGSPADEAGLRGGYKPLTIHGQRILIGGDVITALDDQETDSMETLQSLLQETEPGQEITLTLLREGKEHTVPVTLGERPAP